MLDESDKWIWFLKLTLKTTWKSHFKIMKKYLEIYFKNMEKSWNFVSLEKWQPWMPHYHHF